jgi:hypothetical protein
VGSMCHMGPTLRKRVNMGRVEKQQIVYSISVGRSPDRI